MFPMLRFAPLTACLAMLTACFVSDTPLITDAVHIHDGPVAFCLEDETDCANARLHGDGYLVDFADGEMPVRFALLMQSSGVPVWLGEAELGEEEDRGWIYMVARQDALMPDGTLNHRLILPDCDEASEEDRIRFGFTAADPYTCYTPDLESLIAFLMDRHSTDFADPDWWEAHGQR